MPKTIDDIIPPSRRRQMTTESMPAAQPDYSSPSSDTPMNPEPPMIRVKSGPRFPYGTVLIALVVIAVCVGVLYAFSNAKVEVTPTTQTVTVTGDYTATQGTGDLPYTVITVQKDVAKSVPAESTLSANDSAQGSIVISNAQTKAQTLITNTRFQASSGQIFRIHAPVTIPAGSATAPGTATVTVYADQPGQNFNIGPATFTVPGLQSSAAYTLVTAKSAGSMTGGFSGTRASVSQATDDAVHATLQSTLAAALQSELQQKVPKDYVLVPGSTLTNYTTVPDTATTTATVSIGSEGTLTAVVFPKDALAKAIAYKSVGTYAGEPVTLDSVGKLSLTSSTATGSSTPASQTYDFTMSGTTKIIWKVDTTKIAGAVAGKTRDSAQNILVGFPEVDKVVLILRPFWTSTFPQDPSRIQVTVDDVSGS